MVFNGKREKSISSKAKAPAEPNSTAPQGSAAPEDTARGSRAPQHTTPHDRAAPQRHRTPKQTAQHTATKGPLGPGQQNAVGVAKPAPAQTGRTTGGAAGAPGITKDTTVVPARFFQPPPISAQKPHTYVQRAHNTHSPAQLPLPLGRYPGLLPFGNSALGTAHSNTPQHVAPETVQTKPAPNSTMQAHRRSAAQHRAHSRTRHNTTGRTARQQGHHQAWGGGAEQDNPPRPAHRNTAQPHSRLYSDRIRAVASAASSDIPLFVLQGGRLWREGGPSSITSPGKPCLASRRRTSTRFPWGMTGGRFPSVAALTVSAPSGQPPKDPPIFAP